MEDPCSVTFSCGPILVSFISFFNTRLKRKGDIESPCLRPEFTIIGSVFASPTFILMNVSVIHVLINFTNICGKLYSQSIFIKLLRCIIKLVILFFFYSPPTNILPFPSKELILLILFSHQVLSKKPIRYHIY